MLRKISAAIVLGAALLSTGCSLWAYGNKRFNPKRTEPDPRATFQIKEPRGKEDALVCLALSGGGSRAAYLSAAVMLQLQSCFTNIDLLKEVDVISSVSGGSLAAAYYCLSKDEEGGYTVRTVGAFDRGALTADMQKKLIHIPEKGLVGFKDSPSDDEITSLTGALPEPRDKMRIRQLHEFSKRKHRASKVWDDDVKDLMARNFRLRWLGRWFLPHNIARFWCTSFDRSDIMAQTLAANLFRVWDPLTVSDNLNFRDLNPERPYLIINATNGTTAFHDQLRFSDVFTFTTDDFKTLLDSEISRYEIANAVMASAAFPAAFNYVTLRDYHQHADKQTRYLHVFDGGNADNLGLVSLQRLLKRGFESGAFRYKHVIVILVDSYVSPKGVDPTVCDARTFWSYFVDVNFLHSFDALLTKRRESQLGEIQSFATFVHVEKERRAKEKEVAFDFQFLSLDFDRVGHEQLKVLLNDIPTDFTISAKHRRWIDQAVGHIFANPEVRAKLENIRNALLEPGSVR